MKQLYKNQKKNINRRFSWLIKNIENKNNFSTCEKTIKFIETLYAKSYSGIDLINAINKLKNIDEIYKYKLLVHIDNIKREIKDEKLLMLYILTLAFLRNNDNLENIQEM